MKKYMIFMFFAALITQSIHMQSMHVFEREFEETNPRGLTSETPRTQQPASKIAEEATAAATPPQKPGRYIKVLMSPRPRTESGKVGVTIEQPASDAPDSPTLSESSTSISPTETASDLGTPETPPTDYRPRIHSTTFDAFTAGSRPTISTIGFDALETKSSSNALYSPRSFTPAGKSVDYIRDIEQGGSDTFSVDIPQRSLWSRMQSQLSPIPQSREIYRTNYESLSTDSKKIDYLYKILGLNKTANSKAIAKKYEALYKDKNLTAEQKLIANDAYHEILRLTTPKRLSARLEPFSNDF